MACILTTSPRSMTASPRSMLQYPAIPPKRAECASLQFYGGFNLRHGSTYTLKHHHHHQHTSSRPFVAHSSLFPFFRRKKDRQTLKQELMEAIGPLDRGAEASPQDQLQIEKIVQDLEAVNPNKLPLQSPLLSGKWELLYTTSTSILKKQRPKLLRPGGPIFQAINTDTLRAQNLQTWPFFNQVTANLTPLNDKKVAVKFDAFKIGGLINVKAPDRARGELEITYLDEELRISRGSNGNLFVLRMVDPSYKVPL